MVAKDFKKEVLPISSKLLRFATQFLKDEEEAKDVVQDVFLKLWQKKEHLAEIENIEAFAVRMVRNRCLDILRANKTITFDLDSRKNIPEETIDVHLKLELSETAQTIKELINELPGLQRQVMYLRDVKQYSYEEISGITELNANAIRVNLSRARKKVRDELLKKMNDGNQQNKKITATIL